MKTILQTKKPRTRYLRSGRLSALDKKKAGELANVKELTVSHVSPSLNDASLLHLAIKHLA